LAERGLYTTTPNPRVGCVIIDARGVIGEGWHERAGAPHAEVNALADAVAHGHDPRGATMYVTLEPCNTQGRTPPCVDAVIAAGIGRVVVAMADPNPAMAHGAARLREAGIPVDMGLLEDEARELNIGFVSRMTRVARGPG
jgi:diaminohydroxyphosphoribosylaminopyrimidine deaminase/5-amino-6-(5-phosphoribosylamino)uracil reductase